MVEPIPSGYPRVTPYLIVDGASQAIEFYTSVLGARSACECRGRATRSARRAGDRRLDGDAGRRGAEVDARAPGSVGGSPVTLHVYVEDVDAVFEQAVQAGAKALRPPEDQFYGDRGGQFEDPFGHRWSIATHVEDVSAEEMERRMAEMG